MATEIEQQVERLNQARVKAQELTQEKSRIAGELDALKKRQSELESKCKEEFDCNVEELPELIKQLSEEAEKSLSDAEKILGLREGEPESESVEEEPVVEDDDEDKDGLGV